MIINELLNNEKYNIGIASFFTGIFIGVLDEANPPHGESLSKLISQDPSLLQYGVFGSCTSALIYIDNLKSGMTKEKAKFNANKSFGDYSIGYILGYGLSKIFH